MSYEQPLAVILEINPPKKPNKIKNQNGEVIPLRLEKLTSTGEFSMTLSDEAAVLRRRGLKPEVNFLTRWAINSLTSGEDITEVMPRVEEGCRVLTSYANELGLEEVSDPIITPPQPAPEALATVLHFPNHRR